VTRVTEATNATSFRAPETPRAGACVVLAGGIRPSPLMRETGSPTLDLWLGPMGTVLEHWLTRAAEASAPGVRVQVVHDARMAGPAAPRNSSGLEVSIVAEPRSLRGPAGILKDVCADLDASSVALVGDAARWLSRAPTDLLEAHAARGAAVTVAVNADGSPAGLYAVTVGALERVATRGFVDIKEQWLERLSEAGAGVWTHRLAGAGTLPLRTREQFLEAARQSSGGGQCLSSRGLWSRAEASGAWRVVAPEATVDAGASVVESVVMPGAEIGGGAAVVRSIVGPSARVEAGEIVNAQVRLGRSVGKIAMHRGDPPRGGTS